MKNMKNTVSILLFLFVFLSACSDDSIPEKLKPEPPQPDVENQTPMMIRKIVEIIKTVCYPL